MKICRYKSDINVIGAIQKTQDGLLITSSSVYDLTAQMTGYICDQIFLIVDDAPEMDSSSSTICCQIDCGYEEPILKFYDVTLSKEEMKYLLDLDYI